MKPRMVPDPFIPGAMVRESLADVHPAGRMAHAMTERMTTDSDPATREARTADRAAARTETATAMGAKFQ